MHSHVKRLLVLCTTDSMIWNFLVPHIQKFEEEGIEVECACSRTGFFFTELENNYNLKLYEIPFQRSPYSLANIKAYSILRRLVKQRDYDAIFCHEPVGGVMGRLIGHAYKKKVIYMAHGFHFYNGAPLVNRFLYYSVEKYLSKYTEVLITINEEDYEASKKFNSKFCTKINGIGVNLNRFKKFETQYLRKLYCLSEDSIVLLSVGELIPRKNHETIIKALAELNNPLLHLFIAGEGELKGKLKALISKYNLSGNVHLLGFCKNISELCNSCDIFVFPSTQEGLSMALMEAMACGKPVIASRIRGNVDLIDENKGGILVDTFAIKQYCEALKLMTSSQRIREDYGSYNVEKVRQYSIETVIEELKNVFERI